MAMIDNEHAEFAFEGGTYAFSLRACKSYKVAKMVLRAKEDPALLIEAADELFGESADEYWETLGLEGFARLVAEVWAANAKN